MLIFEQFDLSQDTHANQYIKNETVQVRFAREAGCVMSLEGPNNFGVGDAVITATTGATWSVVRSRFDEKYQAVPPLEHGRDGAYQSRPVPVWAKQIHEPFSTARKPGGDTLIGKAGDWLMQYGPNDWGLTEKARFASVYQLLK